MCCEVIICQNPNLEKEDNKYSITNMNKSPVERLLKCCYVEAVPFHYLLSLPPGEQGYYILVLQGYDNASV